MTKPPVSVIILTFNEEANIRFCLESIQGLSDEIFIVDSFSTDRTLEIAREYTDKIFQNPWVHWAHQRNWALAHLPISNEWVLFLDADEFLTIELSREISQTLNKLKNNIAGFLIKRDFYFLGKWLKYGGHQSDYVMRLVKKNLARILKFGAWEYMSVEGSVVKLNNAMKHDDKRGLSFWIDKHNKYAFTEAVELIYLTSKPKKEKEHNNYKKSKIEHSFRLWFRENIWARLPIFIRPIFYFFYRYIVQLGFLDGKEGLIYCFLHGLWYQFLVDAKYFELKKNKIYQVGGS